MDLPRSLVLCSYAVNGAGMGHLVRLAAINRWLRRYAAFCGVRTQHYFLTTSEADTFLFQEGFASFKLPSKSVVEEAGIHKPTYLALAKQWVWHSVGLLRPDVLVVDTFANGSFQELVNVLDLVRHKALVLRPVKEDYGRRASFRAVAALYDRVVVPDHDTGGVDGLGLEPSKVKAVGPVMLHEKFELVPRAEARRMLGVPDGKLAVLVTGGGGGDPAVVALFDAAEQLARSRADVHVILAAGPLHRGAPRHGPGTTYFTAHGLGALLLGVDVAVSAAGFNSVHENLLACVPTAFLPQDKVADDQDARVEQLVARGAALRANVKDHRPDLEATVDALLAASEGIRERLSADPVANHARDAAAAILEPVLPRSVLRQAVMEVDDDALAFCHAHQLPLSDLVDLAVTLQPPHAQEDRAALELDDAVEVLSSAMTAGVPMPLACSITTTLSRKLRGTRTDRAMVDAVSGLLGHPALAGQAPALLSILRALPAEKDVDPRQLSTVLTTHLQELRDAGRDAFALARAVTRVMEEASSADGTWASALQRARTEQGGPP